MAKKSSCEVYNMNSAQAAFIESCQAVTLAVHCLVARLFRFNSIGQLESSNLFIWIWS